MSIIKVEVTKIKCDFPNCNMDGDELEILSREDDTVWSTFSVCSRRGDICSLHSDRDILREIFNYREYGEK